MTDPLPPLPADQAAAVRSLYAAGRPLSAISAATGLGRSRIYFWLDHDIGPDGQPRQRPLPRRRPRPGGPQTAARRLNLVERIWRAAEAQVCEIETRMVALGSAPAEAERDARALAVLARVVRELSVLDGAKLPRTADLKDAPAGAPADEDARAPADLSRDLDAFRRELARRLDALRGDGAD